MKTINISCVSCAVLLSVACAGAPRPTDQMARAEGAVRAVEEVGVKNVPQAELHQTLAKEQLEKARKLIEEGENEQARSVLERAKADAELALALTREQDARTAATNADAALSAAQQQRSSTTTTGQSTSAN